MRPIIEIRDLTKTYAGGVHALHPLTLDVREGEILALLGPNGAGKTTLISVICGIVSPSGGQISVGGHDIVSAFRGARKLIGLVPQEINVEFFETVLNTVRFSRGLHGKAPDEAYLERILRSLSLWDKRDAQLHHLSGGMKRRVLIAKALAHEPKILFLDEPTAGVDVELRREMWDVVRDLRKTGVTIILTTHYIAEAEELADRVGIISRGRLLLVQEKSALMREFGRRWLKVELAAPLADLPERIARHGFCLSDDRLHLRLEYDASALQGSVLDFLADFAAAGLVVRDLQTEESSLEDVFLHLLGEMA